MRTLRVQHYVRRARDFFEGMQLFRDQDEYQNASALLAVHSAISYSDALRTGLGDACLVADDRPPASVALQRLLIERRFEDLSGLKSLGFLLGMKTAVAYGTRRLDASHVRQLNERAERFQIWAIRTGTYLKIEGWRHAAE